MAVAVAGCCVSGGSVVVDMTTTEPSLAKEIAERFAAKGVHTIDAPVSGGDVGARNATLSIMAGGHKPTLDSVRPVPAARCCCVRSWADAKGDVT